MVKRPIVMSRLEMNPILPKQYHNILVTVALKQLKYERRVVCLLTTKVIMFLIGLNYVMNTIRCHGLVIRCLYVYEATAILVNVMDWYCR